MRKNRIGQVKEKTRRSGVEQIMQECGQTAAVSSKKSEPPVMTLAETATLLPNGFDISLSEHLLTIIFRENAADSNAPAYKITVEEVILRQSLQALTDLCKKGGWPTDIWPEWIHDAVQSKEQVEKAVKH